MQKSSAGKFHRVPLCEPAAPPVAVRFAKRGAIRAPPPTPNTAVNISAMMAVVRGRADAPRLLATARLAHGRSPSLRLDCGDVPSAAQVVYAPRFASTEIEQTPG